MYSLNKICIKCNQLKSLQEFSWLNKAKDLRQSWCKKCFKQYRQECKKETKQYNKQYYQNNKQEINQQSKQWRQDNPEYDKQWRRNNPNYNQYYYQDNQKKIQQQQNQYIKNRLRTDIQYKLQHNLRSRLNKTIQNNQKAGSAIRDLDCSIDWFKGWLEMQWEDGMTWDNYGNKKGQWNIDHIKPLSSFDLTNREQLKSACHWTNLQPMWHLDNIKKGNK
jgi:hypothetical protein